MIATGVCMYNNAFRIGLVVTLVFWLVANVFANHFARVDYEMNGIQWVVHGATRSPYDWGIPFYWTKAGGFFTNSMIVAITSIAGGHIARMLYERLSSIKR